MLTVTLTKSDLSKQAIVSHEMIRSCQRQGRTSISQHTSDESLIKSIATGDKRAMQILYTRHNVQVYRFALRF